MTSLQRFLYFPSEIVFTFLKHFFASFHVSSYFPSPFTYLPSLYFYFPSEEYILRKIGWILLDNKKSHNRMEWLCWIIEWSLLKSWQSSSRYLQILVTLWLIVSTLFWENLGASLIANFLLLLLLWLVRFFFLSGFSLTTIHELQDCRGRRGYFFNSSLPLPPA